MSMKRPIINQGLSAAQAGNHEQRWFFLEKISRHLSSQGEDQSKNWHPFDQIRPGTQIGSDDGLPGTGLGFDIHSGFFGVDLVKEEASTKARSRNVWFRETND